MQNYESRFVAFSNRIERVLVAAMIFLMAALFVVQILFSSPQVRGWFVQTDQLEGVRLQNEHRIQPDR